jgi:RHS repeat-associated protein
VPDFPKVEASRIGLPQAGSAVGSPIGTFSTDETSGTARVTVPLATSAGRGLEPELSLTYSSAGGNGPFGLGFGLGQLAIMRSTRFGYPRYLPSDLFEFGGQILVPVDTSELAGHVVTRYVPRVDTRFERIERWQDPASGADFWRVIDRDNRLSVLGLTPAARVADSADASRIFAWLVEATYDDRGNAIAYDYLAEDGAAQRYLGAIRYGAVAPIDRGSYGIGPIPAGPWHVEVVFDYGQYDPSPTNPNPYQPVGAWLARSDPFSSYEAGFEIRTLRLVRNVLLFHRFDALGPEPVLRHLTRLTYLDSPVACQVTRIDSLGYLRQSSGDPYATSALPPLLLEYRRFDARDGAFVPVVAEGAALHTSAATDFVDLLAAGAPGILYADGSTTLFWAPSAEDPAVFEPPTEHSVFPIPREATGDWQLLDLDGDGSLSLFSRTRTETGSYRAVPPGGWAPFVAADRIPTELASSAATLVDLSGTGRPDLVVPDAPAVRFSASLGAAGWEPAAEEIGPPDLPAALGVSADARVGFADPFGTGGHHLVRITDGSLECWPSLGRGAFGAKVLVTGLPALGPRFDARRVLLADVDGSGTTDVIYLEDDAAIVYLNQSGNTFAPGVRVPLPESVSSPGQVGVLDLGGTGTAHLLVTSVGPDQQTWAYAFNRARRAYVLTAIDNSLGGRAELSYSSSTRHYLEDEAAGEPWVTKPPFPVSVVDRVVQSDALSESKTTISYRYRHGYYDGRERSFHGFGYVERTDAEAFDANERGAGDAVPNQTRTWYVLGAPPELGAEILGTYQAEWFSGDPRAYAMPPDEIVCADDPETIRQAWAALAGQVLRTEVYGLDGTPEAALPYRVEQRRRLVRKLVPSAGGPFSSFFFEDRETIHYEYDRITTDPRVQHSFVLEVDRASGEVTRSATVAYARRGAPDPVLAAQSVTSATADLMTYTDVVTESDNRLGVLDDWTEVEIVGLPAPAGGYFSCTVLATIVTDALAGKTPGLSAPVLRRHRCTYAPGAQALLVATADAIGVDANLIALYAPVLSAGDLHQALTAGGHVPDGGLWWALSDTQAYAAADRFFLPASVTTPFGATISYSYDPTAFALVETRQTAAGVADQVVSVDLFDYASLLPLRVIDVNGNTSEVVLDPLGMVIRSSHFGYELGKPVGFAPIIGVPWTPPPSLDALVGDPEAYLGGAAEVVFYDLEAFASGGLPACWARVSAVQYPPASAPPVFEIDYVDGFGRVVQSKHRDDDKWITSGAVRYDTRSRLYARYDAFRSDSWRFTDDPALARQGVPTVFSYDPLDRERQVLTPKGFLRRTEYAPWCVTSWDENDTVLESPYYLAHPNGQGLGPLEWQALLKAVLCAKTPARRYLDPCANVIAEITEDNLTLALGSLEALGLSPADAQALYGDLQANGFLDLRGGLTIAFQPSTPGFSLHLPPAFQPYEAQVIAVLQALVGGGRPLTALSGRDGLGRVIWSVDPRLFASWTGGQGPLSFQTSYAMTGWAMKAVSADGGTVYHLEDVQGHDDFHCDGRGVRVTTSFDALRRIRTVVAGGLTAEWYVYGDQDGVVPDPRACNLIDQVFRQFDGAGLRQIDGYTMGEQPLVLRQQMLADYRQPVDWGSAEPSPTSPLLEQDALAFSRAYDALERVTGMTDPDGNTIVRHYAPPGWLDRVMVILASGQIIDAVTQADHTPRGQLSRLVRGNGVVTTYAFDPLDFRVSGVTSVGPAGAVLQDYGYVYDPVGNVSHFSDAAFSTLWGADCGSDGSGDFTYDALYRLLTATGPVRKGYAANLERQGGYDDLVLPASNGQLAPGALEQASWQFLEDDANNVFWSSMATPTSRWTTEMAVSDASNRAVPVQLLDGSQPSPAPPPERVVPAARLDPFFDADGDQITVDGGTLAWSWRNELASAAQPTSVVYLQHDAQSDSIRRVEVAVATSDTRRFHEYERTLSDGAVTLRVRAFFNRALALEIVLGAEDVEVVHRMADVPLSARLGTGHDGALVEAEFYTPSGGTAFAVALDPPALDTKEVRYDGQRRDRASALVEYPKREYAPWLRRWTRPDPGGAADGLNLYAFVGGNPTSNTDVNGQVKIELADGTVLEVDHLAIIEALQGAADDIRAAVQNDPITSSGTARKMPLYNAQNRGDLMRLAFNPNLRGDPLTQKAVTSYALKFGGLDVTEKILGSESGVHGTVILKGSGLVGYDEIQGTSKPKAEAKRMIHLFKVKSVPSGNDGNDAIIPVMAISETDRSEIGGLLALVELYNVKYGVRTFDAAFVNNNNPFFVGAKTGGGAKALKSIDRQRRGLALKSGQRMTRAQAGQIKDSLETFLSALHNGRGKKAASKFAGAKTLADVKRILRQTMFKRAGFTPAAQQLKQQQQADKRAANLQRQRNNRLAKLNAMRKMTTAKRLITK